MFIPVLLMGGVIGRIFNEFAVVVTVAILASAFVSLTLTPMLCSALLSVADRPSGDSRAWRAARSSDFWSMRGYDRLLTFCLRHTFLVFLVFVGTVGGVGLAHPDLAKGFFPQEDIGQLSVSTKARQDISFDAMVELQEQVADVFRTRPTSSHVAYRRRRRRQCAEPGPPVCPAEDKGQRPDIDKVLSDLRRQLANVPGIETYHQPVQNLRLGARSSRKRHISSWCRASIRGQIDTGRRS